MRVLPFLGYSLLTVTTVPPLLLEELLVPVEDREWLRTVLARWLWLRPVRDDFADLTEGLVSLFLVRMISLSRTRSGYARNSSSP